MSSETATVVAVVLTGLATLLATTFGGLKKIIDNWLTRVAERQNTRDTLHGLRQAVEVATVLDQFRHLPTVDRVLWFVGKNGGGLPKPGEEYTVRAEHGWATKDKVEVVTRYNFDLIVDRHYGELLVRMAEHGQADVVPGDMPAGVILKTLYTDEGVVYAVMFLLAIKGGRMHYLCAASYTKPFTPEERMSIELRVQRLRGLMLTRSHG